MPLVSKPMNLIEACDKACETVAQAHGMDRLYQKAVDCLGEGALRLTVLNAAVETLEKGDLDEQVFISDESLMSFLCGVWIQFLLVEIAGIEKKKLRAMAQKVFSELSGEEPLCLH